jgi:lysophospholipase L1-like esterase
MKSLYRKKRSIELFLVLAVCNFLIVVPELALRSVDFQNHYEIGVQFVYPGVINFAQFVPDEKLFWRLSPSWKDANSLGFPGREIITPKPKNVYRILFFGCSCTAQGYPKTVETLLNETTPPHNISSFECVNLAVHGYTSHQGRIVAELYGAELKPDLAVVYFGWNDHWLAYETIDSQKKISPSPLSSGLSKVALSIYENIRILQAIKKCVDWILKADPYNNHLKKPLEEVRVPANEYRQNLLAIYEIFIKQNVPVIFITAPTTYYRLGVPEILVKLNFVPNKQFVVSMHKKYNEIVREVAQETDSFLLDLESDFNSRNNIKKIFKGGIHFSPFGRKLVSRLIVELIEKRVLSSKLSSSADLIRVPLKE